MWKENSVMCGNQIHSSIWALILDSNVSLWASLVCPISWFVEQVSFLGIWSALYVLDGNISSEKVSSFGIWSDTSFYQSLDFELLPLVHHYKHDKEF